MRRFPQIHLIRALSIVLVVCFTAAAVGQESGNDESAYSLYLLGRQVERLSDRIERLQQRQFALNQFSKQLDGQDKALAERKVQQEKFETKLELLQNRFHGISEPERGNREPPEEQRRAAAKGIEAEMAAAGTAENATSNAEASATEVFGRWFAIIAGNAEPSSAKETQESRVDVPLTDDERSLVSIAKNAFHLYGQVLEDEWKVVQIKWGVEHISKRTRQLLESELGFRQAPQPEALQRLAQEPYQLGSRYEQAKDALSEAERNIQELERSVEEVENLSERTRNEIDQLLVLTQDNIRTSTAKRDNLQAELQNAYKKRMERGAVDNFLISTIIAMIIAMVALFSSLLLFKRELANDIIEHRVLLELLSMGFLILTVIILGTGRLLTIESLAALIGTIAGYIFGSKAGGDEEEPATDSKTTTSSEAAE